MLAWSSLRCSIQASTVVRVRALASHAVRSTSMVSSPSGQGPFVPGGLAFAFALGAADGAAVGATVAEAVALGGGGGAGDAASGDGAGEQASGKQAKTIAGAERMAPSTIGARGKGSTGGD